MKTIIEKIKKLAISAAALASLAHVCSNVELPIDGPEVVEEQVSPVPCATSFQLVGNTYYLDNPTNTIYNAKGDSVFTGSEYDFRIYYDSSGKVNFK